MADYSEYPDGVNKEKGAVVQPLFLNVDF